MGPQGGLVPVAQLAPGQAQSTRGGLAGDAQHRPALRELTDAA